MGELSGKTRSLRVTCRKEVDEPPTETSGLWQKCATYVYAALKTLGGKRVRLAAAQSSALDCLGPPPMLEAPGRSVREYRCFSFALQAW